MDYKIDVKTLRENSRKLGLGLIALGLLGFVIDTPRITATEVAIR